jgi:hypothetical protein
MVCFDSSLQICRYSAIGDLLEAYYEPRLGAYETRRKKEMERLAAEVCEADAKALFLRAVLEGSMELRRASDDEIVATMKAHTLPAISAPETPDSVDGYEYLLRMRMDRVKASAIKEQEDAVVRATDLFNKLEATTASEMWREDLLAFEQSWQKHKVGRGAEKKTVIIKKKK